MQFRQFVNFLGRSNRLPRLERYQLKNNAVSEQHDDQERGQTSAGGTKGLILKNIQNVKPFVQVRVLVQLIKH